MRPRLTPHAALVAMVLAVLLGCTTTRAEPAANSLPPAPTATDQPGTSPASIAGGLGSNPDCEIDGFTTIAVRDLPPEAVETLELIADDGPYPFRQDDDVFQNRERILPKRTRGYYREYTVITPASDDRGPRRIVTGACGEKFYSADHYASFRLIEN